MNIILHIGQSKTGTTALQSFCARNRELLKEHGILYPDVSLKGMPLNVLNHNPFANSLGGYNFYPRLSADEYWQQFEEQFQNSQCQTMLLSAESFFGGRPYLWELQDPEDYFRHYEDKLKKLKSLVGDASVTVIAYLRPQQKWLESAIPQIIRYEGTMGQRIYEDDEQIVNLLCPRMDYNKLIGLWDKTLTPQKVQLKEYSRQKLKGQNIILDFLELIGVPESDFETEHPADNVHDSWSREFIELKKKLNLKSKSRIQEDTIIDIIDRQNKLLDRKEKYQLPPAIQKTVFEKFESGNNDLSHQYNNDVSIFSARSSDFDSVQYEPVSAELVMQATALFNQTRHSLKGYKILAYNAFKRILKKTSPFLFSFCASQWKKIKN